MPRGKGIRGMHRSQGREVTSSSSALRTPRYEPPDTPPNDVEAEQDSPTDTPNTSHGTPGLSSGASATPMIHDTLPVATVVFGRLMPDRIARRITKIFQKAISSKGFNWKSVPTETKESYFTELKKEFRWPEEEETIIKKAFMKQAAKLYASMVSSWKTKWKDSKTKPECVSEADWPKWLEYWNKPEVAEKAKKNSENRKKEINNSCSKHVGGSKPAVSYFMELQKRKEGGKPTLFELQKQMHMRKDGTYSDDHSKNICMEYERLINEASVENDGDLTTEEKDQVYLKLVGGVKKQRVFGIGSMSSSYASDSRSKASFIPGTGVEQAVYETEMMNVKNELMEEKEQRKQLEQKLEDDKKLTEEKLAKMQNDFQQKLNQVLERVNSTTRDRPL